MNKFCPTTGVVPTLYDLRTRVLASRVPLYCIERQQLPAACKSEFRVACSEEHTFKWQAMSILLCDYSHFDIVGKRHSVSLQVKLLGWDSGLLFSTFSPARVLFYLLTLNTHIMICSLADKVPQLYALKLTLYSSLKVLWQTVAFPLGVACSTIHMGKESRKVVFPPSPYQLLKQLPKHKNCLSKTG